MHSTPNPSRIRFTGPLAPFAPGLVDEFVRLGYPVSTAMITPAIGNPIPPPPALLATSPQHRHNPEVAIQRIEANRRLRCLFPHDRVDPLRAIGRDMRQQSRSGRPEGVEEQCQGVFVAALVGPHEATGVMVDHTREVSVSLPVGNSSIPIRVSPSS